MKTATTILSLTLAAALLLPTPAPAQSEDKSMQESMAQAQQSLDSMSEFIKDVRFDEKDIVKMLELWAEFQEVGEEAEWEIEEESTAEDFEAALKIPAYVKWTKKHGLDRETWLRKVMRVQMMIAHEEYQANKPSDAMMAEQMKQMEKMRETLSEEMYEQMMKGMKEAMGGMVVMDKSMEDMPRPTDEEQALLEKYGDQLRRTL